MGGPFDPPLDIQGLKHNRNISTIIIIIYDNNLFTYIVQLFMK